MSMTSPLLSIVVPAFNEQDNVGPLVDQVRQSIIDAGIDAELIVADDGSTDATLERLRELQETHGWLRVVHADSSRGQSAALGGAIAAARGQYVATLDADLQNDPADLPAMLRLVESGQADMVQGDRTANRRDNVIRRFSSWVGRMTRRLIVRDAIRDTGCSTRMMRAEIARRLPLQYRGMHRFMGACARFMGARVAEMPANHRPRVAGVAKYGVLNRMGVGLVDCFAVRWMGQRQRATDYRPIEPSAAEKMERP